MSTEIAIPELDLFDQPGFRLRAWDTWYDDDECKWIEELKDVYPSLYDRTLDAFIDPDDEDGYAKLIDCIVELELMRRDYYALIEMRPDKKEEYFKQAWMAFRVIAEKMHKIAPKIIIESL